ncbi:DUF4919 domain-containing protein [Rufibacter radiotolerans]|uniref:DUF4919 domain-containing protein n=1 Tax=Rufibacter radiotolerans TaxID=1379910 RepID=UPI0006647FA9|nr:DUF4919 domain-containing protein [Rufibacter radiotolerans]
MKQFLLTGLLCLALLASSGAQTISKVNFDAIKKAIASPKSKLYYPTLLKRYHANDTRLTLDEYKHLYYGWTFQTGYNPYRPNDKSDDLNEMLLYERFMDIVTTGNKILAVDPFNLDVLYLMHMAYGEMNKKVESQKYLTKFEGLMAAIKASGNGRSPQTAVVINAPRDEYMFLTVVNLRQKGRAVLLENKYEQVNLQTPNKLNLTEVYFNIEKAIAKKR